MARERILIVGGGISGLAAAGFLADKYDCVLVERDAEYGGYCRTIRKDGFTWDYSGHFFHFRHKWIADYVHSRMDMSRLLTVNRKSRIFFRGAYVDYPFQFNIHQLELSDFVRCLSDMYTASLSNRQDFLSFQDMMYGRYGRAASDLFLIPYNEKLYSAPASQLDADAMGRFFPHIDFPDLLKRIRASVEGTAADAGYNAQFCYHRDGASAYADALASYVPDGVINLSTACKAIDPERRLARVGNDQISYDHLIISAPLPSILRLVGESVPQGILTANKVLVLNLGFDRPSPRPDHWVYYPEKDWVFFRLGHYDNIFGQDRMSLYVEIAMPQEADINVDALLAATLSDLRKAGVVQDHQLVSWTHVVLDPAYAHITKRGTEFAQSACARLAKRNIYAIGRYGRWTYCSIEDNIVDAHSVARSLGCMASKGTHFAADVA